jgi:hypothetical protein
MGGVPAGDRTSSVALTSPVWRASGASHAGTASVMRAAA